MRGAMGVFDSRREWQFFTYTLEGVAAESFLVVTMPPCLYRCFNFLILVIKAVVLIASPDPNPYVFESGGEVDSYITYLLRLNWIKRLK